MPYDNPSAPVREDNLLADISTGERVAKKWSLRLIGLFVVAINTELWGRHNLRGLANGLLSRMCLGVRLLPPRVSTSASRP